jgi:hypothetical protein
VILCYTWYNLGRVHKSLRCTPAMEAGVSDHVWSVRELLEAARSADFHYGPDRLQATFSGLPAGDGLHDRASNRKRTCPRAPGPTGATLSDPTRTGRMKLGSRRFPGRRRRLPGLQSLLLRLMLLRQLLRLLLVLLLYLLLGCITGLRLCEL